MPAAPKRAALAAAELDDLAAADVLSLGMLADEVRRFRVGDTVTYSRDAETPVTTLPATLSDTVTAIREAKAAGRALIGYSLADVIDRELGPARRCVAAAEAAGLDAIAEAPVDRIADPVGRAADGRTPPACR